MHTKAKGAGAPLSLPTNIIVHQPAPTSIVYPDNENESHKLNITHIGPILSSHEIASAWDTIAAKTVAKLDKMAIDWAAVECFESRISNGRRDGTEAKNTMTLIITVYRMPLTTTSLEKMIMDVHDASSCRVEMRVGEVARHVNAADDSGEAGNRKYADYGYLSPGSRVSFHQGFETLAERIIGVLSSWLTALGLTSRRVRCAATRI